MVTKHLQNAFAEGELDSKATCAKFAHVQQEDDRTVTRDVEHYNLDVIISVGYRVKSPQHHLNPQALTALALLIAESAPTNKDLMVRLILNLLASDGRE